MEFTVLQLKIDDGIALVTVCRPQALNALNTIFFHEMDAIVERVNHRTDVKVMVITGEGKAFVAGADIAEMVGKKPDEGTAFSKLGQNTFNSFGKMDIPVIAAINGFALGGGLELAMACDFRIASSKAKFGQPEVNLGLIPGYAGTQRLPRLVGLANALYLLMTAEMINATDALRIGLVQKVFEHEYLLAETYNIARSIISKGPKAVKLIKSVTRAGMLMDFEKGCELESEKFGSLFGKNSEGEIGMWAFLNKQQPVWESKGW